MKNNANREKEGALVESIIQNNLFPIVPLTNYSKVPKVSWNKEENQIKSIEELKNNNFKNITGYSLICGEKSNVMVIDIDVNHNEEVNGAKSFMDFIEGLSEEDESQIFDTFRVQTPRGGQHLYFKYKKGLKSKANYVQGVDLRTDGGLIVLPGSNVKVDDEVKSYVPLNQNEILEMPQGLFDKFMALDSKSKTKQQSKELSNNETSKSETYKQGSRNQELFKEVISIISKSSIRDTRTITGIARGLNLLKCNPPLEENEVNTIVSSIIQRLHPSYCDEKGNINNWRLVQKVLEDRPSYVKGNLWFIYDDKKGFYDYLDPREIQKSYFGYAVKDTDRTATKSKNFADLLMLTAENAKNTYDEKNYINCKNGVIDINSNDIIPHSPKYKLQVQFNANYIDDWKEQFKKSRFKQFLETTLDKEDIKTMQQAFGLFLSPHAREVEKVFLFKGSGSNGKSVMFDIMESLIDKKYISGVGLGDFGHEFIISMFEGKHANIVRDDDFERTIHKHFKSIATGEEVSVNRKNKDFTRLAFNVTMFFGLNGLPNSKDKSFGFFRRPIIIQFDNTFGTQREIEEGKAKYLKDPTISKDIIENELDIVFSWAYEGLQIVKSNHWNVDQSKKSIEEMEQYREDTDTVYAFYKNCITEMMNNKILAKKLYGEYLKFCEENYIETPVNTTNFGKQLLSFGVKRKKTNKGNAYLNITTDLQRVYGEENPFK